MDIYRDQIEKVLLQLEDVSRFCTSELRHSPKGNLIVQTRNGNHYYSHSTGSGKTYTRTGISGNKELIGDLARKEYLTKANKAAESDIALLKVILSKFKSMDPTDIIKSMSNAGQAVPVELFLGEALTGMGQHNSRTLARRLEEYSEWANEDYRQSSFRVHEKIHLTSSGIYVRSKSEALIAEKLTGSGIPFRYEELIKIDGKWFAPDFTIKAANEKMIYWEHAGLMDDGNYVANHQQKMSYYQRKGIVPWDNLIVTYDNGSMGIDMEEIEFIIRHRILNRL